jgi:hypothetical protein
MEGFKASSSSNGSKEGKDKQGLKRSSSDTDLQRNIDRFQQDELYNLKKPRIEENPESIDHAKEQPTSEIEKAIEQRAQAIMDKYFRNSTDLLADFEKQGVRLLDIGESSSAVDTPLPSQKQSEESTSDALPDESVRTLYKHHASVFKRVFRTVFEQACQENQSEGKAFLQVSAEAHQLAYKLAFLKAKELVLQQEIQKVKRESQKLDQYIQERHQKEYIYTRLSEQILNTTEYYKNKYGLEYKKENILEYFSVNDDQRNKLRETIKSIVLEFMDQNIRILPMTILDIFKEGIKTELNKINQEYTSHR